jgi:hypothetical protein
MDGGKSRDISIMYLKFLEVFAGAFLHGIPALSGRTFMLFISLSCLPTVPSVMTTVAAKSMASIGRNIVIKYHTKFFLV